MGRILATLAIGLLLALAIALPGIPGLHRGSEASLRDEVPGAVARLGERLPDFTLRDLEGAPVWLDDFLGKRVVLTFERSVDW